MYFPERGLALGLGLWPGPLGKLEPEEPGEHPQKAKTHTSKATGKATSRT